MEAGIPVEGPPFIARLRAQLEAAAKRADDTFPGNEYLRIENGEPVLKRLPRKPEPEGLLRLEQIFPKNRPSKAKPGKSFGFSRSPARRSC
jgi:hypothetical protein